MSPRIDINQCSIEGSQLPSPITYSCHAFHIPLCDLRSLDRRVPSPAPTFTSLSEELKALPSLFKSLGCIRSSVPIGQPAIDLFQSTGVRAVVLSVPQHPNRLLCQRLDRRDNYTFVIRFSDPGAPKVPTGTPSGHVSAISTTSGRRI